MKKDEKVKNIVLPVYDADKQCEYIKHFADFAEIPMPRFLSFILAEWIYTIEEGIFRKGVSPEEALYAFLVRAQNTSLNFAKLSKELSKEVKNA